MQTLTSLLRAIPLPDSAAMLRAQGLQAQVQQRTGLRIDPYFSATKLRWLLDTVPGAQEAACRGELAFGTVDSWLLWQLTEGRVHATDATNAARTLLFNIHTQTWDDELLALFDIPRSLLPEVRDSAADFGETRLFGAPLPIRGVAGDQQAAMIGQACFAPGMVKSTYGTCCFMVMNTGSVPLVSRHRLLTTVAYRLDGRPTYALEGSIFIAGAAVQWLRDALRLIAHAGPSRALAVTFMAPVFAVFYGAVFLGEPVTGWMLGCAAVIVGGTLLSTGLIRRRSKAAQGVEQP